MLLKQKQTPDIETHFLLILLTVKPQMHAGGKQILYNKPLQVQKPK